MVKTDSFSITVDRVTRKWKAYRNVRQRAVLIVDGYIRYRGTLEGAIDTGFVIAPMERMRIGRVKD